jgi:hypothetical protein
LYLDFLKIKNLGQKLKVKNQKFETEVVIFKGQTLKISLLISCISFQFIKPKLLIFELKRTTSNPA